MPKTRSFFTSEMAQRLREIRKTAGLTQDQVAARLGFSGEKRSTYVVRLEKGLIHRPYMDTIVHFLHACGIRISALSDLLDRIPPLAEDARLKAIVTNAWPKHAGRSAPDSETTDPRRLTPIERSGPDSICVHRRPSAVSVPCQNSVVKAETAEQRVIQESEETAAKFERHVAYPQKGAPPEPAARRAGTEKVRDYYYQRNIIRVDIQRHLADTNTPSQHNIWFQRLGVKFLSVLRRYRGPKLHAQMTELVKQGWDSGLNPEMVAEVRLVVETRWRMSFAADAEVREPNAESRRMELQLQTSLLRLELYEQAYRIALPLLDAQQRGRGTDYCRLATRCYRAWVKVTTEAGPDRAFRLRQEFAALEQQAIEDGLVPAAVQAVRKHCDRRLTV